jgi:hypothetical protein
MWMDRAIESALRHGYPLYSIRHRTSRAATSLPNTELVKEVVEQFERNLIRCF